MDRATIGRPELRAHEQAMRMPFEAAAKQLRELLTPRLVAYVAGVRETRAVHEWAEGVREVRSPVTEERLRFALQLALLLSEHDDRRIVQAWFQGLTLISTIDRRRGCYEKETSLKWDRGSWQPRGRFSSEGEGSRRVADRASFGTGGAGSALRRPRPRRLRNPALGSQGLHAGDIEVRVRPIGQRREELERDRLWVTFRRRPPQLGTLRVRWSAGPDGRAIRPRRP